MIHTNKHNIYTSVVSYNLYFIQKESYYLSTQLNLMSARIEIIGNKFTDKTAHKMTQIHTSSEVTYLIKSSGQKLRQIFIC